MKDKVIKLIEELAPELNELSLEIYNNPELGYQEYKACRLHTDILKKYGQYWQIYICIKWKS
jgi:metal-dependent amidase/aminoacylase/carboxypeptidase family protein